ncbi:hypothetical protein CIPAW_13G086500 [Carya illinoinensis]|uniref:peroxidase n=1 Tax=Carya illinoinensis TaxID=32201 RepID=A0A8T1NI98_CARIL|nr:hypothetical protein CIPAW_13G086500 [Carya illinoinensis]KAG6681278.1 hypothetical protein I3842_13G085200 [Carya illinoinensis]
MYPTIAPGLFRMHFHNCFVHGCDASILIKGTNTERTAPPNSLLRGFEVIDDAKAKLEATCPGIVSCADILALAARDSVFLSWQVPTGHRDGRVSLASDTTNLPGFRDSVDVQKQKFVEKGLDTKDLVALIGKNYLMHISTHGKGDDPTIDPTFLPQRRALYPPNGDGTKRVGLDHGSQNTFDTSYFNNLRNDRGVLKSDQRLWTDANTKTFVQRFLGANAFNVEFGRSMVKMSNVDVKTGTQGEIRKICSAIN